MSIYKQIYDKYTTKPFRKRCTCGRVVVYGAVDSSGKRHGHCKVCRLEWHYTWDGRIYSHPMHNGKSGHSNHNIQKGG